MSNETAIPHSFCGSRVVKPSQYLLSGLALTTFGIYHVQRLEQRHAHVLPPDHHSFTDDRFLVTVELFSGDGLPCHPLQPCSPPWGEQGARGGEKTEHRWG